MIRGEGGAQTPQIAMFTSADAAEREIYDQAVGFARARARADFSKCGRTSAKCSDVAVPQIKISSTSVCFANKIWVIARVARKPYTTNGMARDSTSSCPVSIS